MKQGRQISPFTTARITTLAIASSVLMLSACGGGGASGNNGGGYNGENNGGNVPSPSGSVSANFVSNGNTPKFILANFGREVIGGLTAPVQNAGGDVTTLDKYTLSGSPAVTQDIAGDANFAMGRWVWGTVSDTSTNTVIGTMNASYIDNSFTWHYLLLNNASSWPSSGTKTCDNGVFTKPTTTGAVTTNSQTTGSLATLSFAASRATLGFTLTTTDSGSSNTTSFSTADLGYGITTLVNGTGGGKADTWILLSDGGSGAIRINGLYTTALPNGHTYKGVFSFKCQ